VEISQNFVAFSEHMNFILKQMMKLKKNCINVCKNFSLTSVDRKIWDRERKWQDKLDTLEDELATSLTYTGKTI